MENTIRILFESKEGLEDVCVRQSDSAKETEKEIMKALEEMLGKEKAAELLEAYQESASCHDEAYLYQIFEKGFTFGFDMADRIYKRHGQ